MLPLTYNYYINIGIVGILNVLLPLLVSKLTLKANQSEELKVIHKFSILRKKYMLFVIILSNYLDCYQLIKSI